MKAEVFFQRFERHFPLYLAEEGDPVGLQIGAREKEVKRIMITLDVRPEVVAEAIEKKIDLLVAKHPPIFRSMRDLVLDDNPQYQMYADLLKHDISVYAAHTNMDIVPDGLNDWFCELLEITPNTFITKTHVIEGVSYGLGRIGELEEATTLKQFIKKIKTIFQLDGLRVIGGNPERQIKTVAICGGSGEKFYRDAMRKGADVYITGDVYYHTGHDMVSDGFCVIDAGHYIEALCKPKIVDLCNNWKNEYNWNVEIIESKVNTNPFTYY